MGAARLIPLRRGVRTPYTTRYSNGRVEVFDPLLRWHIEAPFYEVSLRGDYGIGLMRDYTIGDFSRYRTRYWRFGRWTLYVHLGLTEPHDPRKPRVRRHRPC